MGGTQSLRFFGDGWQRIESNAMQLKASTEYQIQFAFRASVEQASFRTDVSVCGTGEDNDCDGRPEFDGDSVNRGDVFHRIQVADTWEYSTHTFTLSQDSTVTFRLGAYAEQGTVYYVDAVEVVAAPDGLRVAGSSNAV